MAVLRVILGDQLNLRMSSLDGIDVENDLVMMAEVRSEATYVKHHVKKIALIFSAMRHFAAELEERGIKVKYRRYDDPKNQGSILAEVKCALKEQTFDEVVIAHPAEHRLLEDCKQWQQVLDTTVTITPDNRFMAEQSFFTEWAENRKQLRMEYFYREMRKRHNILLEQRAPIGGQWNYDSENRSPLDGDVSIPKPTTFAPDKITDEVLTLVETEFSDHFGRLKPFQFAVTRKQALEVLEAFLSQRLKNFGQYQDAMAQNQPWLFHSHLAFYLNIGLLFADEVVQAAEECYHAGQAPLNSVEGFIRQILGWREYVRGFYWHFMPGLATENYFAATRKLPDFFWHAQTNMNCMRQCISETRDNAYAHHIQRLMVVGNFALLTGLHPDEVNEWYLLVYADAFEWVEMPNVSSMILFADGGTLASKPYAASGSYINKMSDYCKSCGYKVSKKTGADACPFNYLYWDFTLRHEHKLSRNPRMAMIYKTAQRMNQSTIEQMREDAGTFLLKLEQNEEV